MEIQFENLLDRGGWSFYAESIGQAGNWKKITGTILLTPDKTSTVQLVFGDHGEPVEWGVLDGTPENLVTFSVYGFRLLEPGEPESKEVDPMVCFECKGVGTINDTYCPECGGAGTIKKEEVIKEPVTELIKALREYSAELGEEQKRLLKELDKIKSHKSIRRKGAFQLLAGMLASGGIDLVDLPDNEESQYVADAIRFTDLLLKKLGE